MKFFLKTFLWWLPVGVAVTLLCGLMYTVVQQNYRQSLNDPQIQMAEDGASVIDAGQPPVELINGSEPLGYPMIDIERSLKPWTAVYDSQGKVLESNAVLNNAPPRVPQGVLDAAKNNAGKDTDRMYENRVTWQPNAEVRQAVVVVYVPSKQQYIVVGRNMREVENREGNLSTMVLLGWVVTMIATFCAALFAGYLKKII